MKRLTVTGVTYLKGHRRHPRAIDRSHLVLSGTGVSVRRPFRELFSIPWPTLTSLDVLSVGKAVEDWRHGGVAQFVVRRTPFPDALMTRTSRDDAGLLVLEDARSVYWFLLRDRSVDELRGSLAAWAVRAAGGDGHVAANPVGSPEAAAFRALSMVRAAAVGHEPVTDRNTLAYRLSVGNDHLMRGNVLEAVVLIEGLVKSSTEAFGATDEDTIAVRNNLGYAKAVAGQRLEAIRLYWGILDDLAEAGVRRNLTGTCARQNLAKLHNPGWRP